MSRVAAAALGGLLGLALVAAAGCGPKRPPMPAEPPIAEVASDAGTPEPAIDAAPPATLYDRLGGKEGMASVIDNFAKNLLADPRVNKLFKRSKDGLEHFKSSLGDQLCQLAGGPCQYAGRAMKDAHKGMGISDGQFDAVVEDLKLALDEKGVSEQDKSEIFAALAPTKADIVEKKGRKK